MKIFLCYRASDMGGQAPLFAGKIVQRLKAHYGPNSVIMDPGVLPPGADVNRFMKGFVGQADVFLAIIGPQWSDLMRRHAHEADDYVRAEIEAALALGLPVMPVVIDSTPMPDATELPPSVAALVEKPRFRLTSGNDVGTQLNQLMQHIEAAAPQATVAMASPAASARPVRDDKPIPHKKKKKKKRGIMATIAWLVAIPFAAFLAYTIFPNFKPALIKAPSRNPSKDYLNSIGDRMVWCYPGIFKMGSPETEAGRSKDELQHEVTLTQGYWIGAHEITQAQWKLVTGTSHKSYRSQFGTACPVTHVSWQEAVEFCEKLSAREGRSYRLPTEAEWEYACRAGTTGPHNVEDKDLGAFAWHAGNSKGVPQLVGEKDRNNWGLQDMHGNVFEWCLDWYAPFSAEPVTDPKGPETGELKVYRSSPFDLGESYHRSAFRAGQKPDQPASNIGFRIVSFGAPPVATPPRPAGPELAAAAPSASAATIREELITPETKVRFIYCAPGASTMGEDAKARQVTLTQGFWLGETEITRAQWLAVMGKRAMPAGPNRSNRVPIDQIGWDDIAGRAGFLEKIQDKAPAGFAFALPTEAQWEYACRAGTTTKYWWGDEFIPGGANVANAPNTPEGGQVAFFEAKALPTGASMTIKSLKPNPWGFYDMSGNVWEWCQDWYEETPSGPTTDPQGPATGDLKVLKGGAWNDAETDARSAARLRYFPAFRGGTFGFRLALIPKP